MPVSKSYKNSVMNHKNRLNVITWNATSVKNKILELHKLMLDYEIDVAIITETRLAPADKLHLPGYTITRKDRDSGHGKTKRGVFVATHNTLLVESSAQPITQDIEVITLRTKNTFKITLGAVYAPPSVKLTTTDRDAIISQVPTKLYLIGGDLNAKHQLWNNPCKNTNGSTLKKHSETQNYQILHSPTYTHRQPNCRPSNIDIFLSNIPYAYNIRTLDELSSNYLPVLFTISLNHNPRRTPTTKYTNWEKYRQICNSAKLCTEIRDEQGVDTQVDILQDNIQKAFHKSTQYSSNQVTPIAADTLLQDLIRNRNRDTGEDTKRQGIPNTSYSGTSSPLKSSGGSRKLETGNGRINYPASVKPTTPYGRRTRLLGQTVPKSRS